MSEHESESGHLPCWRGCPLDVGTGLREHQWPCEFSGVAEDMTTTPAGGEG